MKAKRFIALTAVLLSMVMLICAGCTPSASPSATPPADGSTAPEVSDTPEVVKPPLHITAVQAYDTGPVEKPKDDTLLEYSKQQMNDWVGREVTVEWQVATTQSGASASALQQIQTWDAAGNAPWLQNNWALHWNDDDAMEYIRNTGFMKDFTADQIRELLPNYTKRIEELGYSVDTLVAECVTQQDGKMYGIPVGFDPLMFPAILEDGIIPANPSVSYYKVFLRDDILKMVYPEALSEQEMKDLLIQKGELTLDDYTGVLNFRTADDIYDYMLKVKELGLTNHNGKPIIPGGGLTGRSEYVSSLDNTLRSIVGTQWRWPICFAADENKLEESYDFRTSDDYRNLIATFNKWFNEGLLDPEIFVMKDDQYVAKAINGEYAIANTMMNGFYTEAVKVAAENNYGWVPMPVGYPYDYTNFGNVASFMPGPGMVSRSHYWNGIPDEEFPDVMKVLDFYCSEIMEDIRFWGHPDWYTGEGAERRFKEGFEELMSWTVYGGTGGKDGSYYGITGGPDTLYMEGANRQLAIAPFSFLGKARFAPMYVYEKNDPDFLKDQNLNEYMNDLLKVNASENGRWFGATGWNGGMWDGGDLWVEYSEKVSPDANSWLAQAIHAKTPEECQQLIDKTFNDAFAAGKGEAVQDSANRLKELYETVIKPQEIK